jgi:hypothetical protein
MRRTNELAMAMVTVVFAAVMLIAAQLFVEGRTRKEASSALWSPPPGALIRAAADRP